MRTAQERGDEEGRRRCEGEEGGRERRGAERTGRSLGRENRPALHSGQRAWRSHQDRSSQEGHKKDTESQGGSTEVSSLRVMSGGHSLKWGLAGGRCGRGGTRQVRGSGIGSWKTR